MAKICDLIGTGRESRQRSAAHLAIVCAHSMLGPFSGSPVDPLASHSIPAPIARTATGPGPGSVARESLYSDFRLAETSTDTNGREWRSRERKKRANSKQSTSSKRNYINDRISAAEHYCFVHNLMIVCAITAAAAIAAHADARRSVVSSSERFQCFHSRGGHCSAIFPALTTRARKRSAVRRASYNS